MNEEHAARTWEEVLTEPMTLVSDAGWRVVQTVAELSPRPQSAPVVVAAPESFVMMQALPQDDEEPASPALPPSLAEQLSLTWAARKRRVVAEEPDLGPVWPATATSSASPTYMDGGDVAAKPLGAAAQPVSLVTRLLRRLLPRVARPAPASSAGPAAPVALPQVVEAMERPAQAASTGPVARTGTARKQPSTPASVRQAPVPRQDLTVELEVADMTVLAPPLQPEVPALVLREGPRAEAVTAPTVAVPAAPPGQLAAAERLLYQPESDAAVVPEQAASGFPTPVASEPTFGATLRRMARRLAPTRIPETHSGQEPAPARMGEPGQAAVLRRQVDRQSANETTRPELRSSPRHPAVPSPELVHVEAASGPLSVVAGQTSAADAPGTIEEWSGPAALTPPSGMPAPTASSQAAPATTSAALDEGEPFSPVLRARIGRLVDVPLKDVRIFRNQAAEQLTHRMGADAATVGSNVYVAPGEGNLGLPSGQALLAHELAHAGPVPGYAPEAAENPVPGQAALTGAGEAHALRLEHAVQRRDLALPASASASGAGFNMPWDENVPAAGDSGGSYQGAGSGYVNISTPFASSAAGSGGRNGSGQAVALAPSDRPAAAETQTDTATAGDQDAKQRSEEEEAGLIERAVEAVMRRLRREAVLDGERRGAFRSELGG